MFSRSLRIQIWSHKPQDFRYRSPWRIHETNGIFTDLWMVDIYSNCIGIHIPVPWMLWACGILLGTTVKNRHILESNACHMCVLTYPVFTHRSSNVCKDAAFSQDKNWRNRQTKTQYRLRNRLSYGILVGGLQPLWKISVKMGIFPKFRCENTKYFKTRLEHIDLNRGPFPRRSKLVETTT